MLACLLGPTTFNITKIELMHLVGDREGLIARVQRRLPGVETTQVEAHMATYCLFATNHQWQVAHRQYNFYQDGG